MQRSKWTFLAAWLALSTTPGCNTIFGITEGRPREEAAASGSGGQGGAHGQGGADGGGGSDSTGNTGGGAGGTSDPTCPVEPFARRAPDECETDGAHDYLTDSENCCVRGRSCLGGACEKGHCTPVLLAVAQDSEALGIAVEGDGRDDRVFWAGGVSSAVYATRKEANGKTTTLTTRSSYVTMLEREGGRLFLTDWASASVFRIPLVGNITVQTVASGNEGEARFAKPVAGHGWVYWITGIGDEDHDPGDDDALKRIWAARADETEQTGMLVMDRNVHVGGLALDETHLYWTEIELGGNQVSVQRVKHGELGTVELVASNTVEEGEWPVGQITVTDRVYWVIEGDIWVIDKSGDAATKGMLAPGGYADELLADATHVYWFSEGTGRVQRVATTGGEVETLTETTTRVRALAQDCRAIYWTQEPEWTNEGELAAPSKVYMLAK